MGSGRASRQLQYGNSYSGQRVTVPALLLFSLAYMWLFQVALAVKNPPANTGEVRDVDWLPRSGRSPGVGDGNPLQRSCRENPMDRGTESDTTEQLSMA